MGGCFFSSEIICLSYLSSYACFLSAENKNRTKCDGDQILLHCKYPKLLNIYSAVYGRELGDKTVCPTEEEQPPPFGESQSKHLNKLLIWFFFVT